MSNHTKAVLSVVGLVLWFLCGVLVSSAILAIPILLTLVGCVLYILYLMFLSFYKDNLSSYEEDL